MDGSQSFTYFNVILKLPIEFNPTRTESSLRRGILHNAVQRDDGSWVWRYARFRADDQSTDRGSFLDRIGDLWEIVSGFGMPVMLVRGMPPQSVVHDKDEAELVRRQPDARIAHVAVAGRTVQGDKALALASLISLVT